MQLHTFGDAVAPQPGGMDGTKNMGGTIPVVGLGAAAGGLRALQQFFEAMPNNSGMAFVVIMHVSPQHESYVAEILQHSTPMPMLLVTKPVHVAPNTVYVIPPTTHLAMADGMIYVSSPERLQEQHVTIDT